MSAATQSKQRLVFTVVLADGSRHTFRRATMPRHWKSWCMKRFPYGTSFAGAKFEVTGR